MTIGIIGLGYVGLTLALAASESGIIVYGIEVNPKIKECIKENHAHFFEPGLDSLVKKHNNNNFFCVDKFPESIKFNSFVVTVGTPLKPGKKEPNYDYITKALKSIEDVYTGEELIVLRSTVSVGTTRKIVIPFLRDLQGTDEVYVAMCPERTVEGKAIEELSSLPQVISGNNKQAMRMARELFIRLTSQIVMASSLEEAELIKLYNNVYRDMSFAIGNAFCIAAQSFGVDGTTVLKNANHGYYRSDIKSPGFVAGPCLEKDAYLLINNMKKMSSRDFILQGREINESVADSVVKWVRYMCESKSLDKRIAVSGMAFKGRPETSDLRGSASVYISRELEKCGYQLFIHDFIVPLKDLEELQIGKVYTDIGRATREASILLILNNNRRYEDIIMKDLANPNMFILDSWDICRGLKGSSDKLFTLGNMFLIDNYMTGEGK